MYFTGLAAETHGRGVSEKHFTITTTCQQGYLQKTCSARACKAGNHTMAASPATNASNSSSFAFVANQISPRLYRTEALGSPTFANHRQKEIGGPSKRGMVVVGDRVVGFFDCFLARNWVRPICAGQGMFGPKTDKISQKIRSARSTKR